ncbi:glyoxalase [Altererythrobacter sp. B11]|uniref:VOC family protein n=1 Tax=Altererythrobacter sp. B11 TaxID=2060312 RepID=UPI000DC6E468|nr:VOC family protein [Altererythrobacter sp. B11]BBC74311.1 glyoxalase [Altererythrobacter sp. B11]
MDEGRVLGIGGVFLRAQDPAALAAWYRDTLGFTVTAAGEAAPDGAWFWRAEGGDTVYSIFPQGSDYFAADRQVMINLRVAGLDALIARLQGAGVAVETRAEWDHPEVGRFARIQDAEGNPVELWEPPAD